jgi:hypothetical protein
MEAHPYIGVACSSALRLGLHTSPDSVRLAGEQRQTRLRTFTTILKLDVYCGLVLGLPPFIDLCSLNQDLGSFESSSPSRQMSLDRFNCDIDSRIALSLKHLEVLKITAFGLKAVSPQVTGPNDSGDTGVAFPVDIKQLEEVEVQFQIWARNFSSGLRRKGDDAEHDM